MKKLMALIALVAMVAVSSVAYANDAITTAGVTNASAFTDTCTASPLTVAFNAATPAIDFTTKQSATCELTITEGGSAGWTLGSTGTNATGDMVSAASDTIGGHAASAVTPGADGGEWGFYLNNTGGNAPVIECENNTTGLCANILAGNAIITAGVPVLLETYDLTIDVAVDNTGSVQPAGTYTDTITLTVTPL